MRIRSNVIRLVRKMRKAALSNVASKSACVMTVSVTEITSARDRPSVIEMLSRTVTQIAAEMRTAAEKGNGGQKHSETPMLNATKRASET
jgi:hypothetical protein